MNTCPYCYKEIDEHALACPHCGRALASPHAFDAPPENGTPTMDEAVKHPTAQEAAGPANATKLPPLSVLDWGIVLLLIPLSVVTGILLAARLDIRGLYHLPFGGVLGGIIGGILAGSLPRFAKKMKWVFLAALLVFILFYFIYSANTSASDPILLLLFIGIFGIVNALIIFGLTRVVYRVFHTSPVKWWKLILVLVVGILTTFFLSLFGAGFMSQ
jgi:hypothetical protein